MTLDYHFIFLPIFLAAITALLIAVFTWRRSVTRMLSLMSAAISIWAFGYLLELSSPQLSSKIFWAKVQYLGIASAPVIWLLFSLNFAKRQDYVSLIIRRLLLLHPMLVILLTWTNESHHLIWQTTQIRYVHGYGILDATYGPAFWLHVFITYTMFLGSTVLLVDALRRAVQVFRRQVLALILASVTPLLGNIIYVSGIFRDIDLAPVAFTISVIIILWGFFRYQLLDIVPIARENVINSLSSGVIVIDNQARIVDINRAACQLIDTTPGEAIGSNISEILRPWQTFLSRYRDVTAIREELMLNSHQHIEIQIEPVSDGDGNLQGRVIILQDITERKQIEQDLRRQALVFENIADSVFLTNLQGVIIDCNAATEKLYGYSKSEIIGRTPAMWHIGHYQHTAEMINDSLDKQNYWKGEIVFIRKDGTQGISEALVLPLNNDDGDLIGRIGVSRDITARKATERLLRQAKENAEAASKAKTAFLANMSHELRTPLTAIIGYSELMEEEIRDASPVDLMRDIKNIQLASSHLLTIIQDILDLTKIEAGQITIFVEAFAIQNFLEEITRTVEHLATKNNNRFEVNISENLGHMRTDQTKVRQILMNLISNALKFTHNGTIVLGAMRYEDENETEWIRFFVRDTGIGIPKEHQQRIFEAFTQADTSTTRRFGGTGLGLTISRYFSEVLGGTMSVDSVENQGSTFTVNIPADYLQAEALGLVRQPV